MLLGKKRTGYTIFTRTVALLITQIFIVSNAAIALPSPDRATAPQAAVASDDEMMAPAVISQLAPLTEGELFAVLGGIKGVEDAQLNALIRGLALRVEAVKKEYAAVSVRRWIERSLGSRAGSDPVASPETMKRAYAIGMKNVLIDVRTREKGAALGAEDLAAIDRLIDAISAQYEKDFDAIYASALARIRPEAGAIRIDGIRGLTAKEHGMRAQNEGVDSMSMAARKSPTVNGAIGTLIDRDEAYVIFAGSMSAKVSGIFEKDIRPVTADDPAASDATRFTMLTDRLSREFGRLPYRFIVVKGLRDELRARGVATGVIFHYGITRGQVYIDEADLAALLALDRGVDALVEAFRHEVAHLRNPGMAEAAVEALAPTTLFRQALAMIDRRETPGPAGVASAAAAMIASVNAEEAMDEYGTNKSGYVRDMTDAAAELAALRTELADTLALSQGDPAFTPSPAFMEDIAARLFPLSLRINKLYSATVVEKGDAVAVIAWKQAQQKALTPVIRDRSALARDIAAIAVARSDLAEFRAVLQQTGIRMVNAYIDHEVTAKRFDKSDAPKQKASILEHLPQWLSEGDRQNDVPAVPDHVRAGIYRGILEARWADLVYAFGKGWVDFGTAGVRNEAIQSSIPALVSLGLDEFAVEGTGMFAPIIAGPNLINAVTLLQIQETIVRIMAGLRSKIERRDAGDEAAAEELKGYDERFLRGIAENRIVIAYDSRLNGRYFAKLLAAAFLQKGIAVDLFEHAAGVPHLAWAAYNMASDEKSASFGLLISASHSEPYFNGLKVYLGYQMSQVDKTSKEMIKSGRSGVSVADIDLKLAAMAEPALDDILRRPESNLRWISELDGNGDFGKPRVSFFDNYYKTVAARSPLAPVVEKALDPEKTREALAAVKKTTKFLYTAFYGVGAKDGADFAKFLEKQGYGRLRLVETQTKNMNGKFPGHKSPDPGIVQGWVVNIIDYLRERAGENWKDIDSAIDLFNKVVVAIATDPDIDRAGMMIQLPPNVKGNIVGELTNAIDGYIKDKTIPPSVKQAIQSKMQDKLLLTANEAWTFMLYWKLKIMEEAGQLDPGALYVIEKSHVTTSALEDLAAYYREKKEGQRYQVYALDTYVGFTEIGKKARDLFRIAEIAGEMVSGFDEKMPTGKADVERLVNADTELKMSVPYQNAGLPIIDRVIELAKIDAGIEPGALTIDQKRELLQKLIALSRTHILAGVEESNGWGELGRWDPVLKQVVDQHINDKDGSLAVFEFLELAAYGKYLANEARPEGMSPYDMYAQMISDIGMVCTENKAEYHPSLAERPARVAEMTSLEKLFTYELIKRLDRGEAVTMFSGRYALTDIEIYRDGKYDNICLGFPEEGVRLILETGGLEAGDKALEASATYRPSGTGDSNRDYNWLRSPKPSAAVDFEKYRTGLMKKTTTMSDDFYVAFLKSLKAAGMDYNEQVKVFDRYVDKTERSGRFELSKPEEDVLKAVEDYVKAAAKVDGAKASDPGRLLEIGKASAANRQAWDAYLADPDIKKLIGETKQKDAARASGEKPGVWTILIGETRIEIPRAAAVAWQPGLVDYLVGMIEKAAPDAKVAIPDPELAALVAKRLMDAGVPSGAAAAEPPQEDLDGTVMPEETDDVARTAKIDEEVVDAAIEMPAPVTGVGKPAAFRHGETPREGVSSAEIGLDSYIAWTTANFAETVDERALVKETLEKGVVIVATDTGMTKRPGEARSDVAIQPVANEAGKYLEKKLGFRIDDGDQTDLGNRLVININGTGENLLDQIMNAKRDLEHAGVELKAIIVVAGDETMAAATKTTAGAETTVGEELKNMEQARILSVEDRKGTVIPVAALYELAVIIGFQIDDKVERCISSIGLAFGADGAPIDPLRILTEKIIRIIPMIRPVNPSEHVEAQKAARAALSSL